MEDLSGVGFSPDDLIDEPLTLEDLDLFLADEHANAEIAAAFEFAENIGDSPPPPPHNGQSRSPGDSPGGESLGAPDDGADATTDATTSPPLPGGRRRSGLSTRRNHFPPYLPPQSSRLTSTPLWSWRAARGGRPIAP